MPADPPPSNRFVELIARFVLAGIRVPDAGRCEVAGRVPIEAPTEDPADGPDR